MGILRTDKISGLETPTAVTGSVVFDGTGDALTITNNDLAISNADYTAEGWFYYNALPSGSAYRLLGTVNVAGNTTEWQLIHATNGNLTLWNGSAYTSTGTSPIVIDNWTHLAVVRSSNVQTLYVNGKAQPTTVAYSANLTHNVFDIGGRTDGAESFNGYISNVRLLKGTALYTLDFTPPTHALEVIGDTVLLCCNNSDSAGAEATGKTISIVGNAAASTFSPGLTRDFTFGTEFKGVTTFDTQGYFVPPSGTTEQRGRGRGLFAIVGAQPAFVNAISYIQISSSGTAQDFGDLSYVGDQATGVSSPTRGIFNSGANSATPTYSSTNVLDFVTIASTSNSVDFGDLTTMRKGSAPLSNSTRGVFVGGVNQYTSPYPSGTAPSGYVNTMDYITMASLGNAIDFGDSISSASAHNSATSNSTRGVYTISYNGSSNSAELYYITISTTGNGQSFGNLAMATGNRQHRGVVSNGVRGLFGGALAPVSINTIDYITISTLGNAADFGDLSYARRSIGGTSNSVRGVFAGGYDAPPGSLGRTNIIDYVTIASTGNAQEFGDLNYRTLENCGASDSHGGLS